MSLSLSAPVHRANAAWVGCVRPAVDWCYTKNTKDIFYMSRVSSVNTVPLPVKVRPDAKSHQDTNASEDGGNAQCCWYWLQLSLLYHLYSFVYNLCIDISHNASIMTLVLLLCSMSNWCMHYSATLYIKCVRKHVFWLAASLQHWSYDSVWVCDLHGNIH